MSRCHLFSGRSGLIGLAFILAAVSSVSSPAAAQTAAREVTRESPTHQIELEESNFLTSVAFSPDGNRVYVTANLRESFDIWAMLVHYWPEILGTITGIALLLSLIPIIRIRRRSRIPGEPYCSRCNYHLSAHVKRDDRGRFSIDAESKCPECGVDLSRRRPVAGKRFLRRAWPALALMLTAIGAYAALWIARVPRDNRAVDWFHIFSPRVDKEVQARFPTLASRFRVDSTRVIELDTATGKRLRDVCWRRHSTYFTLEFTPDGTSFFLNGGRGRLVRVSTATGRPLGSLKTTGLAQGLVDDTPMIVGFSDDAEEVFLAVMDRTAQQCGVIGWKYRTGEQRTLVTEPAYTLANRTSCRRYFISNGVEPLQIVSAPSFAEHYETKKYDIRIFSKDAGIGGVGEPRTIDIASTAGGDFAKIHNLMSTNLPAVTRDATRLFNWADLGALGVDLRTGESLGLLTRGGTVTLQNSPKLSADSRYLAMAAHPDSIYIRDMHDARWAAKLKHAPELIGAKLTISPRTNWLAALPFRAVVDTVNKTATYPRVLLLYDLSGVIEPAEHVAEKMPSAH